MHSPRSQVSNALFAILKNAYDWQTADQRLRVPDDLPANMQPAMFLVKPKEFWTQDNGMRMALTSYTLTYYILIMMRANATPDDTNNTAENQLDAILDAIDNAIQPQPGQKQTLGNLVTSVWIEGEVTIDTPVLFEQCAIWIPIKVLTGL